ncbi:MAG TPA: tryptophan dimethylallyltransferase family protein, partial [Archangium sp.]
AQTPESPTLASNWLAGWAICERLEREFGASLERLRLIEELFAPTSACPRFALWHAVCFREGRAPDFKVYLNPMAWGREQAHALVAEAMRRLGMEASIRYLPEMTSHDTPIYFSLDLAARQGARVKVYTAHREGTASRIESMLRHAPGYEPGQMEGFCRAMAGSEGPYSARPVQTCLAFAEGSPLPSMGTVYFPVRTYAGDDGAVRDRVLAFLHPEAGAFYARALNAFAARPLEAGIGMQTYVSLRQHRGQRRLTVYLAPEVYTVRPAQPELPPTALQASRPPRPRHHEPPQES